MERITGNKDHAADAPENRVYLDCYREMGMSAGAAWVFYAMTNAVPNADAKWLTEAAMRQWVSQGKAGESLDSGPSLN